VNPKIVIVGEAFGEREEAQGRPFVGPSGAMLNAFLSAHGIERKECYLTNVFNLRPVGNNIQTLCGSKAEGIPGFPSLLKSKYVRAEYKPELDRLYREIKGLNPNVIIALGNTACWALLHSPSIRKLRGAPILSVTGHKVLPTYHPAAVLREYKLRPIVYADIKKAARESQYPEIRRPARDIWIEPSLSDLDLFEPHILNSPDLSVDIETWAGMITCIGFSPREDLSLVLPFICHGRRDCLYWPDLQTEFRVWKKVQHWLSLGKNIVGQNFLYDCSYLWKRYGLPIYHHGADTMLMQHASQPEMEKGLGFLGSIYTDEPQWKFMRTKHTLKKED
jgi:uracil-DNA glycosylase